MTLNKFPDVSSKKTLSDYADLIETVAKVEYSRLSSSYLLDFAELINIGTLTVHTVLTEHGDYEHNVTYMSTAIKWAIRNELRRRYKWYSLKTTSHKDESNVGELEKEELREAIYETILSIDELAENENPTQIKDSSHTPEEYAEFRELQVSIQNAIKKLPERERQIVESRFFKGKRLIDLAEEYKISPSRISRIVQSGLDKIKAELIRKRYI